ncbi:MAG TPA: hypothetical protein VGE11_13825 [Pseudonocardia sp.]
MFDEEDEDDVEVEEADVFSDVFSDFFSVDVEVDDEPSVPDSALATVLPAAARLSVR